MLLLKLVSGCAGAKVIYLIGNLDIGFDKVGLVANILPQIVNYKAALEVGRRRTSPSVAWTSPLDVSN